MNVDELGTWYSIGIGWVGWWIFSAHILLMRGLELGEGGEEYRKDSLEGMDLG